MAAFPTTVATDADLYIAVNAKSTQLTDNPLTAGATTVNVVSTSGFPTVGFISIDNEIIKYTGVTGTSFTGCTRAADGTSATSHVQNSQVFHNVIAAHHNALKDDLIAVEQNLSDRIGLHATQLRAPNGSAGAPSYSFANDTDTGFFTAVGNIRMVVGGTIVATVNAAALSLNNAIIDVTDGSASIPAFTFINDGDTGMYRSGTNEISFATGGTSRVRIDGGALTVVGGGTLNLGTVSNYPGQIFIADGSTSLPSIVFATDTNTGIFREGADRVGFVSNGSVAGYISEFAFRGVDGSATFPSLSFMSDTDTGLYRSAANTINISSGGVSVAYFLNTGVGLRGTTTNDLAATGDYGEFQVSTVGNVASPGTGQWFDITSISLTAGDWDVTVIAANNSTNYGACTDSSFGIGITAGNNSPGATQMLDFVSLSFAAGQTGKINQTLTKRLSLTSTTTVYAKAQMTFTAGTQNGLCQLRARRVR